MGVQDLGAIGEFISSLVIVFTLVVLIYEVRQNSALLRRSANRETIKALGDALRPAVEDDELADVLKRFDESYKALSPTERRRAGLYHTLWFQQFELINEDHKIGHYDDEPFEYFARAVARQCSTPGGKDWWEEAKSGFTLSAQKAIDDAIAKYGAD